MARGKKSVGRGGSIVTRSNPNPNSNPDPTPIPDTRIPNPAPIPIPETNTEPPLEEMVANLIRATMPSILVELLQTTGLINGGGDTNGQPVVDSGTADGSPVPETVVQPGSQPAVLMKI